MTEEQGREFKCNTCKGELKLRRDRDAQRAGCPACDWWLEHNDFLGMVRQQMAEHAMDKLGDAWTDGGRREGFSANAAPKGVYPFVVNFEATHAETPEE